MECGIPTAQIHNLLATKYSMTIGFEQVMRVCCKIKGELRRERVPTLTDLGLKETEQEQIEDRIN